MSDTYAPKDSSEHMTPPAGPGQFDFRVRFVLPEIVRLPFTESEVEVDRSGTTTVRLRSGPPGTNLREAEILVLTGGPYPSEAQAQQAGEDWNVRLRRAFSAVGVSAKFERTPFGFSDESISATSADLGRVVMPDNDGVITYLHGPEPAFIRLDVQGTVLPNEGALLSALRSIHAQPSYDSNDHLAYRLWAASDFVAAIAEARFALLMVALESLAQPSERSGSLRAHVEELIRLTSESETLTAEERQPLVGALTSLRKHSVRSACLHLAATMDGCIYDGMPPAKFVKHCYDRRNALMHARSDHPSTQETNVLAANLSRFVGDLLAGRPLVDEIAAFRRSINLDS